jgi:hypothetical protein
MENAIVGEDALQAGNIPPPDDVVPGFQGVDTPPR